MARRALEGRRIVSVVIHRRRICLPQTPVQFVRLVAGRPYRSVERRGKNILIHLDGVTLCAHLRMTGNLYPIADSRLRPHSAAAHLDLDDGRTLVFDDPRGLGVLRAVPCDTVDAVLGRIGVDPLSEEFTAEWLARRLRSARAPIKLWLMDQRRIAGLGNIYAAEALHRAGIDPRRPGRSLGMARVARLQRAIVAILCDAVQSASLAYQRPGGFADGELFDPAVYGREGLPCHRCGRRIRRILQGGRSTYFCPGCQR